MSATLTYDVRMTFHKFSDFSLDTVNPGRCFLTNVPKRAGEDYVLRVGNIDMERGWVEISINGVKELASVVGWVSPEVADRLRAENELLQTKLSEALKEVDQSSLDTVTKLARRLHASERKSRRYKKKLDEQGVSS